MITKRKRDGGSGKRECMGGERSHRGRNREAERGRMMGWERLNENNRKK